MKEISNTTLTKLSRKIEKASDLTTLSIALQRYLNYIYDIPKQEKKENDSEGVIALSGFVPLSSIYDVIQEWLSDHDLLLPNQKPRIIRNEQLTVLFEDELEEIEDEPVTTESIRSVVTDKPEKFPLVQVSQLASLEYQIGNLILSDNLSQEAVRILKNMLAHLIPLHQLSNQWPEHLEDLLGFKYSFHITFILELVLKLGLTEKISGKKILKNRDKYGNKLESTHHQDDLCEAFCGIHPTAITMIPDFQRHIQSLNVSNPLDRKEIGEETSFSVAS